MLNEIYGGCLEKNTLDTFLWFDFSTSFQPTRPCTCCTTGDRACLKLNPLSSKVSLSFYHNALPHIIIGSEKWVLSNRIVTFQMSRHFPRKNHDYWSYFTNLDISRKKSPTQISPRSSPFGRSVAYIASHP